MRAACTVQHQQNKSVSTWVVGTVSVEVWCRLWRDNIVYRVAAAPQCLVVHLSALVCTHAHTPSLLSFLLLSNNFFLPVLVAPVMPSFSRWRLPFAACSIPVTSAHFSTFTGTLFTHCAYDGAVGANIVVCSGLLLCAVRRHVYCDYCTHQYTNNPSIVNTAQ